MWTTSTINQVFGSRWETEEDALIIKIDTRNIISGGSFSNQFMLPIDSNILDGYIDYVIDWGDNTYSRIKAKSSTNVLHTYPAEGLYTVKIYPSTSTIKIGLRYEGFQNERLKILEIMQWGKSGNSRGWFLNCTNLDITAADRPSQITSSLESAFSGTIFTSIPTFNQLTFQSNPSLGQNVGLAGTFANNINFNQDIDLCLVKITTLNSTFIDCKKFNGNLNFDTSANASMRYTFKGCIAFNKPLNQLSVDNVTSFFGTFYDAQIFNQPLDKWKTAKVIDMTSAFQNAFAFNQDISMWDFNKEVKLDNLMSGKSSANYNPNYYDNLLTKLSSIDWTGRVNPKKLGMGTIKYTTAGSSSRANLIANGWTINDGGII